MQAIIVWKFMAGCSSSLSSLLAAGALSCCGSSWWVPSGFSCISGLFDMATKRFPNRVQFLHSLKDPEIFQRPRRLIYLLPQFPRIQARQERSLANNLPPPSSWLNQVHRLQLHKVLPQRSRRVIQSQSPRIPPQNRNPQLLYGAGVLLTRLWWVLWSRLRKRGRISFSCGVAKALEPWRTKYILLDELREHRLREAW